MGFHWYIDIDEENTGKSFSAGPIILTPDQPLKVPDFVEMVNTAFLNAYEDGIHDALYTMAARIEPMFGAAPETTSGGGNTADHYHIDSIGKTLSHGPHAGNPNNGAHSHPNSAAHDVGRKCKCCITLTAAGGDRQQRAL